MTSIFDIHTYIYIYIYIYIYLQFESILTEKGRAGL